MPFNLPNSLLYVLVGGAVCFGAVVVFRIARIILGDMPLASTEVDSSNS